MNLGDFTCRICGARCSGPYHVNEMMFGLRHVFDYYQCDACGVLQISEYPEDLNKYYPSDYYSVARARESGLRARLKQIPIFGAVGNAAMTWLRRHRTLHELGLFDPVGAFVARLRGERPNITRLRPAKLGVRSSVLEIGCGQGALLRELASAGFRHLEGVDPFTSESDRVQDGFVIRRTLAEVAGRFDLVLMADSLEHMPDQRSVIKQLTRVCTAEGQVCISIPVMGQAWKNYGTDWVQLDAPRHFYLHTEQSLTLLAREAGFVVEHIMYDSTVFQFWGSEQYRRGIHLLDARSLSVGGATPLFDSTQLQAWSEEARRLNARRAGDHAVFFLRQAA
jgi:SAM-dependent methyltransferase